MLAPQVKGGNLVASSYAVKDYMTEEILCVGVNDTIGHLMNIFLERDVSRAFVVDEKDRIIGVVTMTDVLRRLVRKKAVWKWRPLSDMVVTRAMTRGPLLSCEPGSSISEACRLMTERQVSGLLVLNRDEPMGVFTKTDAARFYAEHPAGHSTREALSEAVRVSPVTSIARAADLMLSKGVKCLCVTEGDELVGVVGLRTLVFLEKRSKVSVVDTSMGRISDELGSLKVSEAMDREVTTASLDGELAEAARAMVETGYSGLPVLDSRGNLAGMVTKTGVVRVLGGV
ncbi:MAG: hypothetical protein DRN99_04770 [Thermoproteota archaeon]|nr:MAG: hypothetical protein DRN99_04770 [Candidatus Korarchaeota archaeon]